MMCPMVNMTLLKISLIVGDMAIYHCEFSAPCNSNAVTLVTYLKRGLFSLTHCKYKNEPAESSMEATQLFYQGLGLIAFLAFHTKCDTLTFILIWHLLPSCISQSHSRLSWENEKGKCLSYLTSSHPRFPKWKHHFNPGCHTLHLDIALLYLGLISKVLTDFQELHEI